MSRKILSFDLDLDFILISVTSGLKDYKLCYYINKQLNTDFKKVGDYCLDLTAANELRPFSQYFFKIESSETEFYIIANHGTAGPLITEMAHVDYFMLIKNHFDKQDLEDMLSRLRQIENIVSVVEIDPKMIKSNENLMF